jgi:hypothetical protein
VEEQRPPHGGMGGGALFPTAPAIFSCSRSPPKKAPGPRPPPSWTVPTRGGARTARPPASRPRSAAPVSEAFALAGRSVANPATAPPTTAAVGGGGGSSSASCRTHLMSIDTEPSRRSIVSATLRRYRSGERGIDAARERAAASMQRRVGAELRRVRGKRRTLEAAARVSVEVRHALTASAKRRAADVQPSVKDAALPSVVRRTATASDAAAHRQHRAEQTDGAALREMAQRWDALRERAPRGPTKDAAARAHRAAARAQGGPPPPRAWKGYNVSSSSTFLPLWERKALRGAVD